MAKKQTRLGGDEASAAGTQSAVAPAAQAVKATPPRNTDVPPKAKSPARAGTKKAGGEVAPQPTATTTDVDRQAKAEVTDAMIAERAYHLWLAGHPGGETEHWAAAEREMRSR